MAMFHLLKIRTSTDIFKNEKCKVTFGLDYIYFIKRGIMDVKNWRSRESNGRSVASTHYVYWVPVSMQTSIYPIRLRWGTTDSNMQQNILFLRKDIKLQTNVQSSMS